MHPSKNPAVASLPRFPTTSVMEKHGKPHPDELITVSHPVMPPLHSFLSSLPHTGPLISFSKFSSPQSVVPIGDALLINYYQQVVLHIDLDLEYKATTSFFPCGSQNSDMPSQPTSRHSYLCFHRPGHIPVAQPTSSTYPSNGCLSV